MEASSAGHDDGIDGTRGLGHRAAMAEPDDAALVQRARGGDDRAFTAIFERYGRMVHGVLLARTPRSETEDLVQQVFVIAFRSLGSLRDPKALGAWLATIARTQAADWHRRRPAEVELPVDVAGDDEDGCEAEAVLQTIRGLPIAYRETLVLRLVEGLTGPEIAARTGLTAGSVRVNLHRGMRLLRERLGPSDPRPESAS